jgi:hypothetical protein
MLPSFNATGGGEDNCELDAAGGELMRDMLSDEGDNSLSLLSNGDLYGLEGLAVDDPRCLPP